MRNVYLEVIMYKSNRELELTLFIVSGCKLSWKNEKTPLKVRHERVRHRRHFWHSGIKNLQ
jgi:hypothetical protein